MYTGFQHKSFCLLYIAVHCTFLYMSETRDYAHGTTGATDSGAHVKRSLHKTRHHGMAWYSLTYGTTQAQAVPWPDCHPTRTQEGRRLTCNIGGNLLATLAARACTPASNWAQKQLLTQCKPDPYTCTSRHNVTLRPVHSAPGLSARHRDLLAVRDRQVGPQPGSQCDSGGQGPSADGSAALFRHTCKIHRILDDSVVCRKERLSIDASHSTAAKALQCYCLGQRGCPAHSTYTHCSALSTAPHNKAGHEQVQHSHASRKDGPHSKSRYQAGS
jgi:hypothetical protein